MAQIIVVEVNNKYQQACGRRKTGGSCGAPLARNIITCRNPHQPRLFKFRRRSHHISHGYMVGLQINQSRNEEYTKTAMQNIIV